MVKGEISYQPFIAASRAPLLTALHYCVSSRGAVSLSLLHLTIDEVIAEKLFFFQSAGYDRFLLFAYYYVIQLPSHRIT